MGKGAGNALGGIVGLASPLLGTGIGIYNTLRSAREERDATEALNQYERQKLNNVAEGLQVSTLGADLQREEQSRLASSQVQSARESGLRGMIGSLGRIEAGNQMVNRQIGADLDMQQKEIDRLRAEDEARIRSMQENRENQDISALSSQVNAGRQGQATGLSQAVQGVSMIGNSFAPGIGNTNYQQRQVMQPLTPIQTSGIQSQPQTIQVTPYPTSQFGQFGQGMFGTPNPYVNQQY